MASRPRRTLLAALVAASVALPLSGAARPAAVPAPVPAPSAVGPLTSAAPAALEKRYAATRDGIHAAARTAAGHGDTRRAAALRSMAAPDRRFLVFDGRDGGRTVEVLGDLAHAERIAVLVPGADTGLDTYGRFRTGAEALLRELGGAGGRAAVVAWMGYKSPGTVSTDALTPGRAEDAAPGLRAFVDGLRAGRPAARITLLCHSYGSVVCARAAPGLPVADIVLYGSPGTGADHVRQLRTRARVWAGRGADDWIARVPHVRLSLPCVRAGFGTDPMAAEFGARVFDAGAGGHGDYLAPGSVSLANIARIVAGKATSRA
ncbi:alpha/beta hydrolase [Streptomyces sp. NPDC057116]|uniref:alpha/beta hydrolase n=1 Tax=Streptomyces sp. NPDC057116 TaxID=3346023 RepID=UPI003638E118